MKQKSPDSGDLGTPLVADALLAVASLSRALNGQALASDAGALLWMILRQIVPCDAMTVSFLDVRNGTVSVRFAAGRHADLLRGLSLGLGAGITGRVAAHRRPALNANPEVEIGPAARGLTPALHSCLCVPVEEADALIAVLSLYSEERSAYTDDHLRVLDLIAPRLACALVESAIADEEAAWPGSQAAASSGPLRLVRRATVRARQRARVP